MCLNAIFEVTPFQALRRRYYARVQAEGILRDQQTQVDALQLDQETQDSDIVNTCCVLCPTCGEEGSPDSETQRCPECSALGATVGNMAYALSMAPRSDSDGERSRSGWTVASGLETAENVDGTFDQVLQTRSVFENMRWDSTKKSFYLPVGASESSWGWHKKDVGPDPQMPDVSPCPYGQRCSYLQKCRRHHPVQWTKSLGYDGPCPFREECWYLRKCRRYHPPDSNRCDDKSCFQWSFDGSCAYGDDCKFVHLTRKVRFGQKRRKRYHSRLRAVALTKECSERTGFPMPPLCSEGSILWDTKTTLQRH